VSDERLAARAKAISDWMRPPRWRVFSYWGWKRNSQPHHVLAAIDDALRGDYPPLRRYGVALPNRETPRSK